jgi:AraC family transcriptional regulator
MTFSASLVHAKAGLVELQPLDYSIVCLHVGPTVPVVCRRDGRVHHGEEVHGDVEIVAAGTATWWEIRRDGTTLVMRVPQSLVAEAAGDSARAGRVEVLNRFVMREPAIERIGWALKAEIDAGFPNGTTFIDETGLALARELVRRHSTHGRGPDLPSTRAHLSGAAYRRALAYIEDHIDADLRIGAIAAEVGYSASHFKALFRQTTGRPVHRYVLDRRIDRAVDLLRRGRTPISDVALATGFAHPSHLARHLRRAMGVSPSEVASARA